jgi:conjugative relaxase-like TrwC/TraI family protein
MVTCHDFTSGGSKYQARHLCCNDYYEKGKQVEGHHFGKFCSAVGVEIGGVVEAEVFASLSKDKHPLTGEQISAKHNTTRTEVVEDEAGNPVIDPETGEPKTVEVDNRKELCDVVVSAPKSFSGQGVVGGDERIWEWHRSAVAKVQGQIELDAGRQAHNGRQHVELTQNIVGAAYEHDASRAQEAQIHTHNVVFNLTKAQNGKVYALEFREFYDRSKFYTAIYRDELARCAREAGLPLIVDEHGAPQIATLLGVAEKLSTRSEQLKEMVTEVEEHVGSRLSNNERGLLIRASRGLNLDDFRRRWSAKQAKLAPLRDLDPEKAEGDRKRLLWAFTETVRAACLNGGDLLETTTNDVRENQLARLTPDERLEMERLRNLTAPEGPVEALPTLAESIDFALLHLFERKSTVRDYEFYEVVLNHCQGRGVDLEEMKAGVAAHEKLHLAQGQVATVEGLEKELLSVYYVEAGKGRGVRVPWKINEKLNSAQRATVEKLLESVDQFTALVGLSGVGKTFSMADLIEANTVAGHRVMVVAPTHEAKMVLAKEADRLPAGEAAQALREANTVDMFLRSRIKEELGKGDLLMVDEASMISTSKGEQLLRVARAKGFRVLLAGDARQNISVEAGDWFRVLLRHSTIATARLEKIIRQGPDALDGHLLEAVKLFAAGQSTRAFKQLDLAGRIHELRGKSRVQAMAELVVALEEHGTAALAINSTHRENDAVAEAVRKLLHERGQLVDERTMDVHRSLGWTVAQKREIARIKPGQIIEITQGKDQGKAFRVTEVLKGKARAVDREGRERIFTRQNAGMFDICEPRELQVAVGDKLLTRSGSRARNGVITNGERLVVAGWDAAGNPVTTDGRSVVSRNLSYSYASTTQKVQGATAVEAIFGADRQSIGQLSQKIAYVACSRGKAGVHVFVESKADLSQVQNRTGDREAALEMPYDPRRLPERVRDIIERVEVMRARAGRSLSDYVEAAKAARKKGVVDLQPGKQDHSREDIKKRAPRIDL